MKIEIEDIEKLSREETVTIPVETAYGDFRFTQTEKSFSISDGKTEIKETRPCGDWQTFLLAADAFIEVLGDIGPRSE